MHKKKFDFWAFIKIIKIDITAIIKCPIKTKYDISVAIMQDIKMK